MAAMDGTRALLRHAVATVAYRATRVLTGTTGDFAQFRIAPGARTPLEIVAHLGDLFEWAVSLAQANARWNATAPVAWDDEVKRFYAALERFDNHLASDQMIAVPVGQLLQGPVADALTHVGQLSMLRRAAGIPMRSESYFAADITIGRVDVNQPPPRREL